MTRGDRPSHTGGTDSTAGSRPGPNMSPTDTAPRPTLARLQVSLHGVSGLGFGGFFSSHWTEIWVQVSLFTNILKISTVVHREFEHFHSLLSLESPGHHCFALASSVVKCVQETPGVRACQFHRVSCAFHRLICTPKHGNHRSMRTAVPSLNAFAPTGHVGEAHRMGPELRLVLRPHWTTP